MAPDDEAPSTGTLTPTYVRVLLLEAAIILLLWVLGRLFS